LDAILQNSEHLHKLDIKGNDFTKSNKNYFKQKLDEKGIFSVMSGYESDEEDDSNDLLRQFNELKL
jgi:hypothetical protein